MTHYISHRPLNLGLIDPLLRGREWLLRFLFAQTGFTLLAAASLLVFPFFGRLMAKSTLSLMGEFSYFAAAMQVGGWAPV